MGDLFVCKLLLSHGKIKIKRKVKNYSRQIAEALITNIPSSVSENFGSRVSDFMAMFP